jgi:anti-sigma B factor antagonist
MHQDIEIQVIGATVMVRLAGELDLSTAPALRAALEAAATLDVERVVVILRDVSFMDSTGLSALVHGWRVASDNGVAFTLREPTAPVRRVLAITDLDRLLDES